MARDPSVERFIARHSKPPREAVDDDVAAWRAVSPEEKLRVALELCRSMVTFLEMNPNRERVLEHRDPPHPSYHEIMRGLRERARAG